MRFFKTLSLLLLLSSSLLLGPPSSVAAPSLHRNPACDYVFQPSSAEEYGKPDPNYLPVADSDVSKSVILKDVPVLNQRSYGCCWITSYLGYAWRRECNPLTLTSRPSDTFLAIMSLLDRARDALGQRKLVGQGGHTPYAIELIKKYGALPEGVYRPRVDIQQGSNGSLVVDQINAKLVKYFAKTEKLVLAKDPQASKELDRLRQQALSELEKLFDETFGTPPTNFVFEGKKMNRKDYAKMTIPDDMWDLTFVQPKSPSIKLETVSQVKTVYPQPNIVDPELLAWRIVGNFVGDAEWRSIDDAIERSLRANEPVLFGVQIKRAFIDSKRGMMSVEAYSRGRADFLEEIQTMASAVESYTDGGHAVLITGIYRNSEGKTLGYRIQNSWGDEVGQQGYFDADVSYMRTFFPRFFFKKGMFKPTS